MKKWISIILAVGALPAVASADEGILLQRIVALEQRVAELETKLAPVLEAERVKGVVAQQKKLARSRIMMDAEFLSRHDLNIVEKLYQTANKDWAAEDAGKALAILTERYPRANRTGCAVLARAQSVDGQEQLDLLKKAIETYNSSFYSNGVQVGPYARLYLAMRYKKEGQEAKASKLFDAIRTDFPDAVDSKGKLLTAHLKGMD